MLALWEDGHLLEIFGEPWCGLGDVDKAVLDHRGLRVQAHDLVAGRLITRDTMAAIGNEILDQLGARALSSISTTLAPNRLCCSRTARLSAGNSRRRRNTPRRTRLPATPQVVHAEKSLSSVA